MFLTDRLSLDGIRKTADGYLVASVRAARTGIQVYTGDEVGRPELATVRVYRPEEEVFHKDALRSYAYRPVTLDHPPVHVSAENWRDYARGQTGGDIARDGEFVSVPLVIMDAAAIKAVEDGKREVSQGYNCELEWKDGVTPQGEAYDAIQRSMRMNHLAIVSLARGGSNLRIGDDDRKDNAMPDIRTRTVMVDGLSVETTDAGAQAIEKLTKALADAKGEAATAVTKLADAAAAHKTALETKDGQIAALTKQVEDGKLTPQKLDAAVAARAALIADAKKIAGDKLVTDGKTSEDIRRATVAAKLGDDIVKPMSDAAIEGAFVAFAKQDATGGSGNSELRDALKTQVPPANQSTVDKAYQAHVQSLRDGYKQPEPKAA